MVRNVTKNIALVCYNVSIQYMYCNVMVQDVPHVAGLLQYNSFHTILAVCSISGDICPTSVFQLGTEDDEQVYSSQLKSKFAQNIFSILIIMIMVPNTM